MSKEFEGISVRQSKGDADSLIVSTALDISSTSQTNVIVVGTDVDLFVLLIQLGNSQHKVYYFKQGHGKEGDKTYDIASTIASVGSLSSCMLFVHAISGCDTTSAAY